MPQIAFKGNILTAKRIAVYILLFVLLMGALCYLYFWHWSYPLFQFIGAWQDSLMILQLAGAAIGVLAATHFLSNRLFPNRVRMELSDRHLLIDDGLVSLRIPLNQLKHISFFYLSQHLNRITIYAEKKHYLNVGGIIKGLPESQFEQFVSQLRKRLQKDFSFEVAHRNYQADKVNNLTYDLYAPTYDLIGKRKSYKRWIVAGVVSWLIVCGLAVYAVVLWKDDGSVMVDGTDYGRSQFSQFENKVYYLDAGKGNFELEGADANSFTPFTYGNEFGTETGCDNRTVYWGYQPIVGIDRNKAVYLGRNYIRDDKQVFYKNIPIEQADLSTFRSVDHAFNTLVITYATDKNHVYYQQFVLAGMQPKQVRFFDDVTDVVADSSYVYFKNNRLEGLVGRKADVRKIDHGLVYSTDHQTAHFVNGLAFPEQVADNIWGIKKQVHLSHLHLLQEKNSSSAHLLFFDGHRMYYYDEEQKSFYHIKTFDQPMKLKKVGDRIFTDGKHIYFTERTKLGVRNRSGSHRPVGIRTTLYRLAHVSAVHFKKVEQGDGYEIFSDGEHRYISILGYGNKLHVNSGLYYLSASTVNNVHRLTREDLSDISQKEKIFHINSRNNY